MSDWMDKLEDELGALAPKSSNRDLVAAALCAHRDSEVVTAKRLRREPSAAELESAFQVLEARCPGLIASGADEATSMAVAFVRTPGQASEATPDVGVVSSRRNNSVLRQFVMAVALMLCFAGGIAIGLRSAEPSSQATVANTQSKSKLSEQLVQTAEQRDRTGLVQASGLPDDEPRSALVAPPSRRSRSRLGRQRSSLSDLGRAYHRTRVGLVQTSF
ncbi:MAG: hypothetical protein AB8G99_12735 [Planctomycetaceae bacterium]